MAADLELEDLGGVRLGLLGVSANLTPPAFIRPPVSTWDLITDGPADPLGGLARLGGVVQKPYSVTGIPASSTIRRDSYS